MTQTFEALKTSAQNASSLVALYATVKDANEKIHRNIGKAQMLSYSHGRAAEAHHYFQNVIPGWQNTVNEINAIWSKAVKGKSADEIVEIVMEVGA